VVLEAWRVTHRWTGLQTGSCVLARALVPQLPGGAGRSDWRRWNGVAGEGLVE
jgi:hypothetical protein